jgi:hypothetical protein
VKCSNSCPYPLAPIYNPFQKTGFPIDWGFPAAVCVDLARVICSNGVLIKNYNSIYLKDGISSLNPTPKSYNCYVDCNDSSQFVD